MRRKGKSLRQGRIRHELRIVGFRRKKSKVKKTKRTKGQVVAEEIREPVLTQHIARRLKVRDNINTDYVISGRYKFRIQDPGELARHIFEDIDPFFAGRITKGDILVAGENFGCGSSREQAPQALKWAFFYAIAAKSFARIFYRNAFNIGLMLIECDTGFIDDGDTLELDIDKGKLRDVSKGLVFNIKPIPDVMKKLLEDGGVIEHFKKHGGFNFNESR